MPDFKLGQTGSKSTIKGTWIFQKALKGHAVLVSCPTGFRLLNQSGHTFQIPAPLVDKHGHFLTKHIQTGPEVQQCQECARFILFFALYLLSHIHFARCSCSYLLLTVLRSLLTRVICSGEFMFDSSIPMLPCQTCPPQGICPNKGTWSVHILDAHECADAHSIDTLSTCTFYWQGSLFST